MPPLLQQVRGATVLTICMTDTPSNLPVAYTNLRIHFICTHMTQCITQAEEEWDFLSSREGESPSWINPCLRVLVPSPSWIGLDSFCSLFFFLLPSILNEHNSKFPDSSLSQTRSEEGLWTHSSHIENIFSLLASSCLSLSLSLLSLLCFLSRFFFFAFHFFTGNCCCCILWEWGIFFTWVSVEKGGQSIKFELLKTIATSSSALVSILCCVCHLPGRVDLLCFPDLKIIHCSPVSDKYAWMLLGASVVGFSGSTSSYYNLIHLNLQKTKAW